MELDAVGSATANSADLFSMSFTIRRQPGEKVQYHSFRAGENELMWSRFRAHRQILHFKVQPLRLGLHARVFGDSLRTGLFATSVSLLY
jgi:hypothetical protein